MICPDTFYEMNLKGKNADQIMIVINELKQKIDSLKNIVENPDYKNRTNATFPSDKTQIVFSQYYLERAKQTLEEVGGAYIPSSIEKKSMDFDNNIPHINKIEFRIGGYFEGFETTTFIIKENRLFINKQFSYEEIERNTRKDKLIAMDKKYFLEELKELRIGEWLEKYDTMRFGYTVCDGTHWSLEIEYTNDHKPVKIYGDNAYPYNFNQLLNLFGIEE